MEESQESSDDGKKPPARRLVKLQVSPLGDTKLEDLQASAQFLIIEITKPGYLDRVSEGKKNKLFPCGEVSYRVPVERLDLIEYILILHPCAQQVYIATGLHEVSVTNKTGPTHSDFKAH